MPAYQARIGRVKIVPAFPAAVEMFDRSSLHILHEAAFPRRRARSSRRDGAKLGLETVDKRENRRWRANAKCMARRPPIESGQHA
jgi:hypothetical protein